MAPSSAAHAQRGHISFIYILRSSFYGGGWFDQYYFCFGSSGGDFVPPLRLSKPRRCTISFQKGDISQNQTNCLVVKFISCFILIVLNHLLFPPFLISLMCPTCVSLFSRPFVFTSQASLPLAVSVSGLLSEQLSGISCLGDSLFDLSSLFPVFSDSACWFCTPAVSLCLTGFWIWIY